MGAGRLQEEKLQAVRDGTELFRKVYRKEISEGTFQHKHFGNPTALSTPYIIEFQNGTPVAMRWLMKLNFCFGGIRLAGAQSSDDAVSEEARGLIFLKMRKKTTSILEEEHIDFEYGCFYRGAAMEIAEKVGERNVINLQLARLYLNEKKHRWKRFDIPYPTLLRLLLTRNRKQRLSRVSDKGLLVRMDDNCPFMEGDYQRMNADNSFHVERTAAYFEWKTGHRNDMCFVTAHDGEELRGYLIIKKGAETGTVVDWDIFSEKKMAILSALLLPLYNMFQYLDIPSLNCERGEMKLFTALGAKDMSKLWAPICICMKPLTERADQIAGNPRNWKHRLLDADYFLNGDT